MADTSTNSPPNIIGELIAGVPTYVKAIIAILVIVAGFVIFNYVKDLQTQVRNQTAITQTLAQKFNALSPNGSAQTSNTQATAPQVNTQTSDAFGAAVVALMRQQNSTINSLTTAISLIKTTSTVEPAAIAAYTPETHNAATGKLSDYVIEEARIGAPPLTSISLSYLPTDIDPSTAFAGTKWTHYQEQFSSSFGSWEKQSNGALSTTVRLTRTVSKPDPLDPTKLLMIGTEDIPITGANTVYTPTGLVDPASVTVPRWTLGLGVSTSNISINGNTTASQLKPFGTIDYRLTNRFGVFTGIANGGLVGGVSIRFGSPK